MAMAMATAVVVVAMVVATVQVVAVLVAGVVEYFEDLMKVIVTLMDYQQIGSVKKPQVEIMNHHQIRKHLVRLRAEQAEFSLLWCEHILGLI